MAGWRELVARYYAVYARATSWLRDPLLLVLRLYWGWQLTVAGWNKLTNIAQAARFFKDLDIPMPAVSAVMSGSAECFGGLLLIAGLGSRIVALVLIFNMSVAYITAHADEARALFSSPHEFVSAPPFLYLLVNVIVLIFGPGLLSLDALFGRRRASVGASDAGRDDTAPAVVDGEFGSGDLGRRQFVIASAAAIGGVVVGALLRGMTQPEGPPQAATGPGPPDGDSVPDAEAAERLRAIDAEAPEGIQPTLLLEEPHVCRGLNTCKARAKNQANSCAGQGACATAAKHDCNGLNECKGQGGCGEYPGQNLCEGKGACAVSLKKDTWAKARTRFEALMKLKKQTVGAAPSQ